MSGGTRRGPVGVPAAAVGGGLAGGAAGPAADAGERVLTDSSVRRRVGQGRLHLGTRCRGLRNPEPGREGEAFEEVGALTPAEHDVACLAVQGLTSREIAERLFVSPRTVGVHLGHVFEKLGIISRRELRPEASSEK